MKVRDMTWEMVERYLERDDRCVLPLGSTEQHAYISLATDSLLAERLAIEAAMQDHVPVFPVIPYGITPYFMAYPGTVTLSPATYEALLADVLRSLRRHGFRRFLVLNGHGGNREARPAVERWAAEKSDVQLRWHDWWRSDRVRTAIESVDPYASHASWMETFPWTRVEGVTLPDERKEPVDLSGRDSISLTGAREHLGDGSFGGWYERPPEVMDEIWSVAVSEARELLADGWS